MLQSKKGKKHSVGNAKREPAKVAVSPSSYALEISGGDHIEDTRDDQSDSSGIAGEMDSPTDNDRTVMAALYDATVRPCIDLIDKLRALGIDKDVPLPSIAVVGDQSAGKSSTLEALSGIQLPRGKGIVTRCPLELRLKSLKKGSGGVWRASIKYTVNEDGQLRDVRKDIERPEQVSTFVSEAQDALAGKNKGISHELITLEVESESIPDLTLIDLPGIARVAVEGQPKDIPHQIKHLITKYVNKEETIILAVVPANVDIATTEALSMAKEVDPDGKRTLGVITKPDLVDRGAESEVIAVLSNQVYPLQKGYCVVKCRGQHALDEGISIEEALREEDEYFQGAEHFRDFLDGPSVGTRKLAEKLTMELVEHITNSLPELKRQVSTALFETNEKLRKLGNGLPETKGERRMLVSKLVDELADTIRDVEKGDTDSKWKLYPPARSQFEHFAKRVRKTGPKPNGKEENSLEWTRSLQEIEKEIVDNRGCELPRFMKFSLMQRKVRSILELFREDMVTTLDEVDRIVGRVYEGLTKDHFYRFHELHVAIKGIMVVNQEEAKKRCTTRLNELIEMEGLVYTQDENFNEEFDALMELKYKNKKKKKPNLLYRKSEKGKRKANEKYVAQRATQQSYYLPSVSTTPQPGVVDEEDEDDGLTDSQVEAEAMMELIACYLEVCKRRIADQVPMELMLGMIRQLAEKNRVDLRALAMDEKNSNLIRENPQVEQERKVLKLRFERLRQAVFELEKYIP